MSKDQQISHLQTELRKLQEHVKTSELKKTDVPKIYVITPTYARYLGSCCKITTIQECHSFIMSTSFTEGNVKACKASIK